MKRRLAGATPVVATTFVPPYPPSWADRLQGWVERLPFPPWAAYLVLLLAVSLLFHAALWLEGSLPPGSADVLLFVYALVPVYFLALSHYLNATARQALAKYRPLLDVSDHEYAALEYNLTKVPRRIGILAVVIGVLIGAANFIPNPASWGVVAGASALQTALGLLDTIFVQVVAFYWFAQVIRQARAIDRVHRLTSRINLFRRDPIYAFSALTLRSALGLVLFTYAYLLGTVFLGLPAPNVLDMVTMSLGGAIALAIFVLPLWRMHRLLTEEKRRLLLEADERYSALVGRFNRQLDKGRLADLDVTGKAIASLASQREVLARVSTWPWRPEALRSLLSTMAAPIILYLISRLLGRLFGV
jgi:hypothetical protein